MSEKIEKNEKCLCGGGVKYKMCCLTKENNTLRIINKYHSIIFSDHRNYIPKKKSQLLYVINSTKLPNEINRIINNYIRDEKLIKNGCWYNSSHLSLIEEKIKIVHGYYGVKLTKDKEQFIRDLINFYNMTPNIDGWYLFDYKNGKGFFDLKNNMMLYSHSWNQFEDIHFDLTKETDLSLKNEWVYYYPIKTESTSSIDLQTKNQLIHLLVSVKNEYSELQMN